MVCVHYLDVHSMIISIMQFLISLEVTYLNLTMAVEVNFFFLQI